MNCEICGTRINGPAVRIEVEGARLLACHRCQKLGKPYHEPPRAPVSPALPTTMKPMPTPYRPPARKRTADLPKDYEELEVAEDYAALIREKRAKLGLSQDDLAKRVKEKLSIIQKIEIGKMVPDTKLSRELEHELRIKLLVPRKEIPAKAAEAPAVTLGDIVQIKGKGKDELEL